MSDKEETDEAMRFMLERAIARDLRMNRGEARNMVDRWQDEMKAEAWEEGRIDGQINAHEYRPGRAMTNPYRTEKDA